MWLFEHPFGPMCLIGATVAVRPVMARRDHLTHRAAFTGAAVVEMGCLASWSMAVMLEAGIWRGAGDGDGVTIDAVMAMAGTAMAAAVDQAAQVRGSGGHDPGMEGVTDVTAVTYNQNSSTAVLYFSYRNVLLLSLLAPGRRRWRRRRRTIRGFVGAGDPL